MNGDPLTREQAVTFQHAANQGDFVDRLLIVLLHTGLTATEYTHIHDDWLEPLPESTEAHKGTTPIIRIPSEVNCRGIELSSRLEFTVERADVSIVRTPDMKLGFLVSRAVIVASEVCLYRTKTQHRPFTGGSRDMARQQ